MYYLDYRLSKILSDIRIEQSRPLRKGGLHKRKERQFERRLGLPPIHREEQPSGHKPRAA